jgi:hypothetical protein
MKGVFIKLQNHHEAIHNIAIVIALTIGAIWALYTFKIKTKPAIVIESSCQTIRLSDYRQLVRVTVNIQNRGNGSKVYPKGVSLIAIMNNLEPTDEYLEKFPSGPFDYSQMADKNVFELLGKASELFSNDVTIEPDDSESYNFNYLVNPNVKNTSIYASVRNGTDIKEKGFYSICNLNGIDADYKFHYDEDDNFDYSDEDGDWCVIKEQQQQSQQQQQRQQGGGRAIKWCKKKDLDSN